MADWTTLDLETLLPGEPLTSAKVTAMYENPIAIAEGAPDAPRINPGAVNSVAGVAYSIVAETKQVTLTDGNLVEVIEIDGFAAINSPLSGTRTLTISIAFSTDNGSSFGSFQTLFTRSVANTDPSESLTYRSVVSVTLARFFTGGSGDKTPSDPFTLATDGSLTIPANVNAFRVRQVTTGSNGTRAAMSVSVKGPRQA